VPNLELIDQNLLGARETGRWSRLGAVHSMSASRTASAAAKEKPEIVKNVSIGISPGSQDYYVASQHKSSTKIAAWQQSLILLAE
jgi:hypothetical protein